MYFLPLNFITYFKFSDYLGIMKIVKCSLKKKKKDIIPTEETALHKFSVMGTQKSREMLWLSEIEAVT